MSARATWCALLALAVLLAGCTKHPALARPAASPKAATSPQRALLAPGDLHGSWSRQPAVLRLGYDVRGCPAASEATDPTMRPGETYAETNLQASATGPFLDEALTSGPPQGARADTARLSAELIGCRHLTLGQGARSIGLDLVPVAFAKGVVAARMEGQYSGLPVAGYIVYGPVTAGTAMALLYLGFNSVSSDTAYEIYRTASAKARAELK